MSYSHPPIDSTTTTGQVRPETLSRAELDPMRDGALAGSRPSRPTGIRSSEPQEVPAKLIDAWSRWAASRLG